MREDKRFRYLTSEQFLKLTPKDRVKYLKRVTDYVVQRAKQRSRAKKS